MSDLKITRGAELAQHLLTGETVDSDDLDQLVKNKIREDLHLDYKHGKLLDDPKAAGQELRRHVSGFANAEGGVLIIGIAEEDDPDNKGRSSGRPSIITGCHPPHKVNDLDSWAKDVLAPLRPITVVTRVVQHSDGLVLLVAVARSPHLVQCLEKGSIVHYLRIGDGTYPMDSYLYADLVLGRRQEPDLEIVDCDLVAINADTDSPSLCGWQLRLENQGLVWVPDWRAGIIGYSLAQTQPPSDSIRRQVEQIWTNSYRGYVLDLMQPGDPYGAPPPYGSLPPLTAIMIGFESIMLPAPAPPDNPMQKRRGHCTWRGGLYIVPSNGRPMWAQLTATIKTFFNYDSRGRLQRNVQTSSIECVRLKESDRPYISIDYGEYLDIDQ